MRRQGAKACVGGSIVGGMILMTIGLIFLLDNFNVLDGSIGRWWPLLLIVIGGAKLIRLREPREKQGPYSDFGPSKN